MTTKYTPAKPICVKLIDGVWQTAARTMPEALQVAFALTKSDPQGRKWSVTSGPKSWATDKPLCYLVLEEK